MGKGIQQARNKLYWVIRDFMRTTEAPVSKLTADQYGWLLLGKILEALEQLGYRKLPDEPPLLSDGEIGQAVLSVAVRDQWCFRGDTLEDNLPSYQAIAQAQGEADWEWFKESRDEPPDDDIVEDGFGTSCSAYCPECHEKSMYVCRPGDIRCSNCY